MTSYWPPVPVVPVVRGVPSDDMIMPVDTPLTSRVPLARMLICTVMAILVLEPKGPLRVSVSEPLTAPPPAVTLLPVIWRVQVVKVMLFPASGPVVKAKVQEPKDALAVDVEPALLKLAVVGLVKVSVAELPARLGSKIPPFAKVTGCPTTDCTVLAVTGTGPLFTLLIVSPLVTVVPPPSPSPPPQPTMANALMSAHTATR